MPTVTIQPGDRGADFTVLTPDIKKWLLAEKVKFVCRYVVPPTFTKINKDLKGSELDWYAEHGIAVVSNFERSHNDATVHADDAAKGREYGKVAKDLSERFGFPHSCGVWVSVDEDIYHANIDQAEKYVRAFAQAIHPYRLGLYGDSDIAYRVRDLNPLVWRPAAGGWDREPRHVDDHIRQHLQIRTGHSHLDPNTCLQPFTAWIPGPDTEPTSPQATMRNLPKPIRVYDSRPDQQHQVNPAHAEQNKNVPKSPFEAWETREIVVGMVTDAYVVVTAIGGGAGGYFSVNDPAGDTSLVGFDVADRVETNGAPVSAPGGKIKLTACVGPAHVAVDVYAVAP